MKWKVYILFSRALTKTYTGCTSDVDARLKYHNSGRSTKHGVPWVLIYEEPAEDYKEARRRERYFKNASGRKKISEILRYLERSRSPV